MAKRHSEPACARVAHPERDAELRGVVVTLQADPHNSSNHESATRNELGRRLAALKGFVFAGEFDREATYAVPKYFLPAETIVGTQRARQFGIASEEDLFGAVVPHPFMAAKTITHPLVDGTAHAPEGWCHAFCDAVHDAVLHGYAAFSMGDLRRATHAVLARGPARVKRASGIGGLGQTVIHGPHDLDRALAGLDEEEIGTLGIVVEENLAHVTTHSVGQVHVAGILASYCGTQSLTANNRGVEVYGGSTLFVVRGDFDVLLAHALADDARRAIAHACTYDTAARQHLPGMFASRRNYDVAIGTDLVGNARCGVLEQSWRMGGASGAEIAALEAFRADPALRAVRARSTEIYGECDDPPEGAAVYFRAVDERVGMLTKFATLERHADA